MMFESIKNYYFKRPEILIGKLMAVILGACLGFYVNGMIVFFLAGLFLLKEFYLFSQENGHLNNNFVLLMRRKVAFNQNFLKVFIAFGLSFLLLQMAGEWEVGGGAAREELYCFFKYGIVLLPFGFLPYTVNQNYWYFPLCHTFFVVCVGMMIA